MEKKARPIRRRRNSLRLTALQSAIRALETALSASIYHLETEGRVHFGYSVLEWRGRRFYLAVLFDRHQHEYHLIYDTGTRRVEHFTGADAYRRALDFLLAAMKCKRPPEKPAGT